MIAPAAFELQQTLQNNQKEFADLVEKQAVEVLNCDPTCIHDCVNDQYIEFLEIPQCLKYCPCGEGVIEIGAKGEYNYPSLIQFNGYDLKAWSFFKNMQHTIWRDGWFIRV